MVRCSDDKVTTKKKTYKIPLFNAGIADTLGARKPASRSERICIEYSDDSHGVAIVDSLYAAICAEAFNVKMN